MSELKNQLKALMEGTYEDRQAQKLLEESAKEKDEPIGESEVDEEMMAEATLGMIFETAYNYAIGQVRQYLEEHAHELVRDGLLTESVAGQSFVSLSVDAQKRKAESMLRMNMANKAGDARAIKIRAMRKTIKRLTQEIHNDSRYSEARSIVMKRQFRHAPDAKAMSARRAREGMKLM